MEETFEFLKIRTQVNYVSTVNGDKPSCRPFGDPVLFDGKIYVLTNATKKVAKQIKENNNVCIVAYDGTDWIRVECKFIDDSNNINAKKAIIDEFDWMEEAGYTLDNPDFKIFYLANATSSIYDEDGNEKAKYTF